MKKDQIKISLLILLYTIILDIIWLLIFRYDVNIFDFIILIFYYQELGK